MQWPGERLETVFLIWLVFGDLEGAFDPMTHEMADAANKSSYSHAPFGNPCGFQSPILPLKVVFRCAGEIEDLFDGSVDEFV